MPYRSVFDVVWSGRRHIMMMASQIDRTGNQNISAVGPHDHPKVQLVGVRGAPGNSVNHPTSYWVPDHSPRTFVEHVDVVCGVGYGRAAAAGEGALRFHDVRRVVSNLGVFDFETPDRTMRLCSYHPGVASTTSLRQPASTSPSATTSAKRACRAPRSWTSSASSSTPARCVTARCGPDPGLGPNVCTLPSTLRSASGSGSVTRSCRPAWAGLPGLGSSPPRAKPADWASLPRPR